MNRRLRRLGLLVALMLLCGALPQAHAAPVITSTSPSSFTTGSGATALTVFGSFADLDDPLLFFVPPAGVPTALPLITLTDTEIETIVAASLLSVSGIAELFIADANDTSARVRIAIAPPIEIPEPSSLLILLGLILAGVAAIHRHARVQPPLGPSLRA
jgi:hypothetical protein